MNRTLTLAWYLTRDLFRSLAGIAPLAAGLAFGWIAFEYGMDQPQFVLVAGIGTGAICLLTVLLLAGRADRASSYPLVARLPRRTELLSALVIGGIGVTAILALVIAAANLLTGRLALDFPSVLWVLPTWLVFWILASSLALVLSTLVSRRGSHLAGYVLLTALLVVNDQQSRLAAQDLDWLAEGAATVLWPVSTLFTEASAGLHGRQYWLGLGMALAYGLLLFALAALLFLDKDLLWTE
jgi:hypothetical protein